jgi:PAS domain S-box-containing protein
VGDQRTLERITGYSSEEALGRTPAELLRSTRHSPEFFQRMWTTVQSGEVFRTTMWGRRKDGSEYRQHTTISPVHDSAGELRWLVGIKRDVEEQERVRELLAEREQTFRRTVDVAVDAILISDRETGHYEQVNQAALRMFGYTRRELSHMALRTLAPSTERAKIERLSSNLGERDRGRQRRLRMQRADGSTFVADLTAAAFEAAGRGRVVTVLRDVTDVLQREAELAQSEARYRAIFERSGQAMLVLDPAGIVLQANACAVDLLASGTTPPLPGMTLGSLFPDAPDARSLDDWRGIVTRERPDGSRLQLHAQSSLVVLDGGQQETIVSFHDVTDLLELQAMREGFVKVMSDDGRAPLEGLSTALDMLADGAGGELPAGARELTRVARRDSQRLQDIAREVLERSAPDEAPPPLEFKHFELGTLVSRFDSASVAGELDVTLVVRLRAREAWIDSDPRLLSQVLRRFVTRAIRNSPRGGTVTLTLEAQSGGFRLTVCDEGSPIPSSDIPMLFTRFGGGASSDRLHEARAIMARLGGDIGYEPDSDLGGCLWAWVPTAAR